MLGFPILYLKGMRAIVFQLSGFYCSRFLAIQYKIYPSNLLFTYLEPYL